MRGRENRVRPGLRRSVWPDLPSRAPDRPQRRARTRVPLATLPSGMGIGLPMPRRSAGGIAGSVRSRGAAGRSYGESRLGGSIPASADRRGRHREWSATERGGCLGGERSPWMDRASGAGNGGGRYGLVGGATPWSRTLRGESPEGGRRKRRLREGGHSSRTVEGHPTGVRRRVSVPALRGREGTRRATCGVAADWQDAPPGASRAVRGGRTRQREQATIDPSGSGDARLGSRPSRRARGAAAVPAIGGSGGCRRLCSSGKGGVAVAGSPGIAGRGWIPRRGPRPGGRCDGALGRRHTWKHGTGRARGRGKRTLASVELVGRESFGSGCGTRGARVQTAGRQRPR